MVGKEVGSSTISQQLAKLLFKGASQNKFQRAFQNWERMVCCSKFGERYTRRNHHALYFNKFDFLHNTNGDRTRF